jgi:molybdopterin converting factor small subunit
MATIHKQQSLISDMTIASVNSQTAILETVQKHNADLQQKVSEFEHDQHKQTADLFATIEAGNNELSIMIDQLGESLVKLNEQLLARFSDYNTKLAEINAAKTKFIGEVFLDIETPSQ